MNFKRLSILFFLTTSVLFSQTGFVYTYYSTGEIEGVLYYAGDILEGTSYWYYQNGNLKTEKTYSNGKLNGLIKEFYDTGLMKSEISVKYGIRDGITKYYYENGALQSVLSYEKGELLKRVDIDYDPNYIAPLEAYKYANTQDRIKKNNDLFLCEGADICPKPAGGMNEILKHLVFPKHAKLYGVEGFVKVIVSVDSLGIVRNIDVIEDLGLGTKEAAIEAIKASRFLPAEKDGKQVASKVLFKIPFMLNGKVLYATPTEATKGKNKPATIAHANNEIHQKTEKIAEKKKKSGYKTEQATIVIKNFTCNVDVCPKPKDGIKGIMDNFVLPSIIKRKHLEGNVVVNAVVDKYGNVRDTKVVKDLGYGSGVAVEVAILETKFEPGLSAGNPVRATVKIIFPIIQPKN